MDSGKACPHLPRSSAGAVAPPLFAAVIRPHRSLDARGFRILMVLSCLATTAATAPFLVLGFWPVAGFLALALLGLYVAFRINFRAARSFEEVVLSPIELLFRQTSHRGERREWRFNPLWTRIDRQQDEEFGLQRLCLVSGREEVVVAGALSPAERESFAEALGRALAQAKRGS